MDDKNTVSVCCMGIGVGRKRLDHTALGSGGPVVAFLASAVILLERKGLDVRIHMLDSRLGHDLAL